MKPRLDLTWAFSPCPGNCWTTSALDLVRDLVGCVTGPADLSVNKAYLKTFGR
jgi:hypothetical protein